MNHYQKSFIVKTNPEKVYAAITTIEGLRDWWTHESRGETGAGGTIHFNFGNTHKEMRVELLKPNSEVRWLCKVAYIDHSEFTHKDEWVGTEIIFRLTPDGKDQTRVDFDHIGLVPTFECYEACKKGWDYFLDSLQAFAETGRGTPYESGENCAEKIAMGSN